MNSGDNKENLIPDSSNGILRENSQSVTGQQINYQQPAGAEKSEPIIESLDESNPDFYGVTPVAPPKIEIDTTKFVQPEVIINTKEDEEDSRILKPFQEKVEVLDNNPKVETTPEPVTNNNIPEQNAVPNKVEESVMENTPMKKVNIEYKEPSGFKMFLLGFTFVVLLLFIVFLPQINTFISSLNDVEEQGVEEKVITDGVLSCNLEDQDKKYDYIYNYEFHFSGNSLDTLNFAETIKGDYALDFAELNLNYNNCKGLSKDLETLSGSGVSVSCDIFEGTLSRSQTIDYSLMDEDTMLPLYQKYALELPEYENKQNIDDIERNMKASGYTCEKRASENKNN